jgi:hypothetical protein
MLFFCVISCEFDQQYQNTEKFSMNDFKRKIDLSGIELIDESMLYKPMRLYLIDDSILVMLNIHSENHFLRYNLHRKEIIGDCIPFGSGPGEMIAPKYLQQTDTLVWIFDSGKRSMIAYSTHDFCVESSPNPVFVIKFEEPLDAAAIGKNEQVISTVLSSIPERLCFFDKKGQLLEAKGALPVYSQHFTVVESIESFLCNIAVNPTTGSICLPYKRTDLIEFYDSNGLLLKRKHGPDHFFPVLTQINRDNMTGIRSIEGKTRDGYFSPFATKNELYVLYSGKYFNKEKTHLYLNNQIFTFDWGGNAQNIYLLDIPIFDFVVDEKQNKIYGITDDPEFRIIEFQLLE